MKPDGNGKYTLQIKTNYLETSKHLKCLFIQNSIDYVLLYFSM